MNKVHIYPVIVFLFCIFISCGNTNRQMADLVMDWQGKEILFPNNLQFMELNNDSICLSKYNNCQYKILDYTDTNGCVGCRLRLYQWKDFIKELDSVANNQVVVFKYVYTKKLQDTKFEFFRADYKHPVCFDLDDSLNKLNHFPENEHLHCFLLDENNRVLIVGNPVQYPKIKNLYLRTISEGLGLNFKSNENKLNIPEVSLGKIPQSESKSAEFVLPNNSKSIMQIDSVFTSCECTTASVDKIVINPSESANLTVSYTPDGVGEFYREVYVQIKGEERPRIYKIRGIVE